ncbi:3-isopropylmalate dehydratase large subunit, partial [Candidatus Geothermarchaeota archaeon]
MTEKILSRKIGRKAEPGEIVFINVDYVMAHDGTAPLAIEKLKKLNRGVFNPEKVVLVIDHTGPSPKRAISNIHKMMR